MKELPPKRRIKVPVTLDRADLEPIAESLGRIAELRSRSRDFDREVAALDGAGWDDNGLGGGDRAKNEDNAIGAAIMECYRLTGQCKVNWAKRYILNLLAENPKAKVLVFAHHKHVLDSIHQELNDEKIRAIKIDGSVASEKRHDVATDFQTNMKTRVAVLSITAAGAGLNFTAAQFVVFAELHMTPGMLLQAEDRAHRIGQTATSVDVHILIANGTYDEQLWEMISKKIGNVTR